MVVLVDGYQELLDPREVMGGVVKGQKPCGRGRLGEYRGEDKSLPIKGLYKMTQRQAKKEMRAVGLQWLHTADYSPQQHVMVFSEQ